MAQQRPSDRRFPTGSGFPQPPGSNPGAPAVGGRECLWREFRCLRSLRPAHLACDHNRDAHRAARSTTAAGSRGPTSARQSTVWSGSGWRKPANSDPRQSRTREFRTEQFRTEQFRTRQWTGWRESSAVDADQSEPDRSERSWCRAGPDRYPECAPSARQSEHPVVWESALAGAAATAPVWRGAGGCAASR